MEITQSEQQIENKQKKSIRERNNNKMANIHFIQVSEEEKKCITEKIFEEIVLENFPNLAKGINLHIQKAD